MDFTMRSGVDMCNLRVAHCVARLVCECNQRVALLRGPSDARIRAMSDVRKGQAPEQLSRDLFSTRFRAAFVDPAFDHEDAAIARLEEIAWSAYVEGRKAPHTEKAGPSFADP